MPRAIFARDALKYFVVHMDFVSEFIVKHRLPEEFRQVAESYYLPLCDWVYAALESKRVSSAQPLVLGINGAQGTGKSTLADFIAGFLSAAQLKEVAVLSIDDFYLSRADRKRLAQEVHPLLATRGVPGTHDLPLASETLDALIEGQEKVALPRFDKSIDDRAPEGEWLVTSAAVDLVIFEGWCVGSVPESTLSLREPINALEQVEDVRGDWRNYVNNCLAGDYQKLFSMLDHLVLLKAPDFECVYKWRLEQEQKLADKVGADAEGIMDEQQIARFIQHYERLTRHNLHVLPQEADLVLTLDRDHQVKGLAH